MALYSKHFLLLKMPIQIQIEKNDHAQSALLFTIHIKEKGQQVLASDMEIEVNTGFQRGAV